MAYAHAITSASGGAAAPRVRKIAAADLTDALRRGWDDFTAMPSHAVFLCLIYPVVGLVLAQLSFGYRILPLLYPMASGFVLIGPVAAIGLYELSRRRERGEDAAWTHAFDVFQSPARWAVAMLGLMLVTIFVAWLVAAQAIYWLTFGEAVDHMRFRPLSSALFGIVTKVIVVVLAVVLMATGIGFPFGVALLLVLPIVCVLGMSVAAAGIVGWIFGRDLPWLGVGRLLIFLIGGALVIAFAGIIPVTGPWIVLAALVFGFGGLLRAVLWRFRIARADEPGAEAVG